MTAPANEVDRVRDEFVQLWGSLGTFWGVSPTTARIFGWLMARSEPADAQEIMTGLGLSRGAVSMACRELREWQLITEERVHGARRVVYRPETNLERVLRNVFQIRKRREWDPIRENMRDWIPALKKASPSPDTAEFLERLDAIDSMMEQADAITEFLFKGGTVANFGFKALYTFVKLAEKLGADTVLAWLSKIVKLAEKLGADTVLAWLNRILSRRDAPAPSTRAADLEAEDDMDAVLDDLEPVTEPGNRS